MHKLVTRRYLIAFRDEIEAMQKNSIVIPAIHRDKFAFFFQKNHQELNIIEKKRKELTLKYIECDAIGNPMTIDKADGSKEYIWKTKSSSDLFKEESESFLNISVDFWF